MPRFNVHVYTPYRVKFSNIEAESAQAAAEIAYDLPHNEASEIEDTEGIPIDALVDEVEIDPTTGQPTGEINVERCGDGLNFDYRPNGDGTATAVPFARRPGMKTAKDLTREQLEQIVTAAQELFWSHDDENDNRVWDPDTEWSWDRVEQIAGVMIELGLQPERLVVQDEEEADDEEANRFLNHYEHCGQYWTDEAPYTNNDRCPVCHKEIEPFTSEDL